MTKEEQLKQEAEEYAQGMAKYYESAHGSIPSQFEKYLRNVYISSAESREKRISELEELLINSKNLSDTIEKAQKKKIAELEKDVKLLGERCNKLLADKGKLTDENTELKAQLEKIKCCGNCRYKHCDCSSQGIDPDGNYWFHNWNEEKEDYCDTGKGKFAKYQLWEIKEK